jgi:hypothetical protein
MPVAATVINIDFFKPLCHLFYLLVVIVTRESNIVTVLYVSPCATQSAKK